MWARTLRTVLMALGWVGVAAFIGISVSFALPASMYEPGGLRGVGFGIMLSLFYAAGSVPYLIANVVYAIRRATSLRGHGYSVSRLSSAFLVAAPILVAISVAPGVALLWWHLRGPRHPSPRRSWSRPPIGDPVMPDYLGQVIEARASQPGNAALGSELPPISAFRTLIEEGALSEISAAVHSYTGTRPPSI